MKSPEMWAGLKDRAAQDAGYAMHYKWLYDSYGSWDENRRAQLNEIMLEYHPQPMAEQLIQKGKQGAGLEEIIEFIKDDRYYAVTGTCWLIFTPGMGITTPCLTMRRLYRCCSRRLS